MSVQFVSLHLYTSTFHQVWPAESASRRKKQADCLNEKITNSDKGGKRTRLNRQTHLFPDTFPLGPLYFWREIKDYVREDRQEIHIQGKLANTKGTHTSQWLKGRKKRKTFFHLENESPSSCRCCCCCFAHPLLVWEAA